MPPWLATPATMSCRQVPLHTRLLCAQTVSAAEAGAETPVAVSSRRVFYTLLRKALRM